MNSEIIEWREWCSAWERLKAGKGKADIPQGPQQETARSEPDFYGALGRAVGGLMEEDADFRALVISLLCKKLFAPVG